MTAWSFNLMTGRGSRPEKPGVSRGGLIVSSLFLTPFFLVGVFVLVLGLTKIAGGDPAEGWPMTGFALLFLSVASGMLALVIHGYRRSQTRARVATAQAESPWLWREDWAERIVRSNRRASLVGMWLFAIFWNGVSSPLLFVFRREWEQGNKAILVGLLFPLIGIGLLIAAIRMTLQWRRFGPSVLHLETLPGCLGRHFQARLTIPSVVTTLQEIKLRLACIRRTTTGSGKNRRTSEKLLWEEKRVVPHKAITVTDEGLSLPVFFDLPHEQPETVDGNPAIVWRLEARADLPGVDYDETFEVPVFRPNNAAPTPPVEDPLADFQERIDPGVAPVLKGVRIRETANGVSVDFRPGRNPGVTTALIAFTIVWTGILVFLVKAGAPLLFPIIWGLFALILIAAALSALFHGVKVEAADGTLTIRHRLIAPITTRTLAPGTVQTVHAIPGMQSGRTQFYKLEVVDQSGRHYQAGGGIREKRDAVWIAERLAIAVGL